MIRKSGSKINYKFINNGSSQNTILLHGILGNHRNLTVLTTDNLLKSYTNFWMLDLRNHGNSFHSESNKISDHVNDIIEFIEMNNIKNISIVGHSFGGRIGIEASLLYPKYVDKLCLLDIGPYDYNTNNSEDNSTKNIILNLNNIDLKKGYENAKTEITRIANNNTQIAGFFLTNLIQDNNELRWRCNMESLANNIDDIISYKFSDKVYLNPVKVIAGSKAKFVNPQELDIYKKYFPCIDFFQDFKFLDAGHWIHFERPDEVKENILEFLKL